jgi:hypothetical protein
MRVLASITTVMLLGPALLAQDAQWPFGTYRLILCANPCTAADTARAVATAIVVIVDTKDKTTRAAWDAVSLPTIERPRDVAFEPNACFKVTEAARMVGAEELNFGIIRSAKTYGVRSETVNPSSTAFYMPVYKSIDAAYELRWTAAGPLVRGEGWSLSPDIRTPFHRNAYFAAERTGDPDPAQCK